MSEPDLWAQDVLDVVDAMDRDVVRQAKVARIVRTYNGQTVTGASQVTVLLDDEEVPCDWLRAFHLAIVAGLATEGAPVLVHLLDNQCVIADLIMLGVKTVG